MSSFSPVGQTIWPDIGQVTVTCGTQTVRLAKVILVVTEKKKITGKKVPVREKFVSLHFEIINQIFYKYEEIIPNNQRTARHTVSQCPACKPMAEFRTSNKHSEL